MDLRKVIRDILNENFNQSIGLDIIKHLSDIPETRAQVNWSEPRTFYNIPDLINRDVTQKVFDKEQIIEYVNDFEKKFGTKPIFRINNRNIEIWNHNFNDWRNNIKQNTQVLKQFGTTD